MIGVNKRYPAYKAKTEFRNKMRREQEKQLVLQKLKKIYKETESEHKNAEK